MSDDNNEEEPCERYQRRRSLVVDNRPGAGGIIGTDMVAKAAPDGYTMLLGSIGHITFSPALYRNKLPYDPQKDFAPISLAANQPFVMTAHPSFDVWYGMLLPAGTPRAVIAKANTEIVRLLKSRAAAERFVAAGLEPLGSTPEAFAAVIKREIPKWEKVVKSAGIKVE